MILPGTTAPDWGPAAIGSNAGTYPASGTAASPGASTGSGTSAGHRDHVASPPAGKAARLNTSVPRSVGLADAVAKGILIHARGSASGRVTATVLLGRRQLASVAVHVSAGARAALRLRLSRTAVKQLRRAHASRVTVTVTLIPATGSRVVKTKSVHLTRR